MLRQRLLDHEALTGVLVARIHVRDEEPWAVSVRFDDEAKHNRRPHRQKGPMAIKCNFCPKTIEAPLWPDEKPPGWDLTPAPVYGGIRSATGSFVSCCPWITGTKRGR